MQPLTIDAPPEVARALATIGRTEDSVFSPDGTRVAIAGFGKDTLVLLDVAVHAGDPPVVTVSGCTTLHCAAFDKPHGVAFADDVVLVANRNLGVNAVPLAPPAAGVVVGDVQPVFSLDAEQPVKVVWPGSIRLAELAPGLFEAIVCNNYVHRVTRHLLDIPGRRSFLDEILLAGGRLDIPDGVAFSRDGRWMAISNHETHTVLIYDRSHSLDPLAEPTATLRGLAHAHGLCFALDDTALLVADGGTAVITVFERGDAWSGDRYPDAAVRVMSDEMFALNNRNPGEGGTKGIDIHRSGLVTVLAGEARPVAFFDTRRLLGRAPSPVDRRSTLQTRNTLLEVFADRDQLRHRLERHREREAALTARAREQEAKIGVLEQWIGALRERSATPPSE